MITDLQDRLEEAYSKIDDLENRARCYNFRIRDIPENVKDITSITYSLMQAAVPDIDEIHMEIDCIHRALVPPDLMPPPRMFL